MTDTGAPAIRFDDGEAYERGMGVWSRLVGEVFLDWLAPPGGLGWVDVGCGNGAFTELLTARCSPSKIDAIDPSEGQLAYARTRPGVADARFRTGNAAALPFDADSFDAAVMALVIFFVPDPARGVAEMVRVVRPGGLIAAYAWDIPAGGLPFEPFRAEVARRGMTLPLPPSADVSREDALRALWSEAGLQGVDSRVIEVRRTFADFETFWSASLSVGGLDEFFSRIGAVVGEDIKNRVRAGMKTDSAGRILCSATANAVRGRTPG